MMILKMNFSKYFYLSLATAILYKIHKSVCNCRAKQMCRGSCTFIFRSLALFSRLLWFIDANLFFLQQLRHSYPIWRFICKGTLITHSYLLVISTKINIFYFLATKKIIILNFSIGITVEEIAIIYLALPFTTFLAPPITGNYNLQIWDGDDNEDKDKRNRQRGKSEGNFFVCFTTNLILWQGCSRGEGPDTPRD